MSAAGDAIVGVLALQGDFAEHAKSLARAGAEPREVRTRAQLADVDGLIIPGGESTTISRLLLHYDLHEPIAAAGRGGLPIWGTCAGAILMATEIEWLDRPGLSLIPMAIERNAYGDRSTRSRPISIRARSAVRRCTRSSSARRASALSNPRSPCSSNSRMRQSPSSTAR